MNRSHSSGTLSRRRSRRQLTRNSFGQGKANIVISGDRRNDCRSRRDRHAVRLYLRSGDD